MCSVWRVPRLCVSPRLRLRTVYTVHTVHSVGISTFKPMAALFEQPSPQNGPKVHPTTLMGPPSERSSSTVYTLRVLTDVRRGSGLSEPMAGVWVCLMGNHATSGDGGGGGGGGGGAFTPGSSPCPSTAPSAAEAVLVYKLHEYVESRGIASVVPVATPNDTSEPELLGMSPEQAEETAAKLRELETDMLLHRQGVVNGCFCCGFVVSLADDSLPDHLRVWEMSLT